MGKALKNELQPLAISCDNNDCETGLHCFRTSKRKANTYEAGKCQYCGADVVDWERIRRKLTNDIEFTINSLQNEWIRHHFWHIPLSKKAQAYALKRAEEKKLEDVIKQRIKKSIGGAKIFRDGTQTSFESDNPIHSAQHATATCCRKCVEYWYNIERGRELTDNEIDYFSKLIYKYIEIKILNSNGESELELGIISKLKE